MWVVKLGGSLHDSPALRDRLAELATLPGPRRIVVPGGGPFADLVRSLQRKFGYDDLAAHRMAILAMQQFGLALHALEPRLSLAETEPELRAARAAIWLPWRLARAGTRDRGELGRHLGQPRLLARDPPRREPPRAREIGLGAGRKSGGLGQGWPGRPYLPALRG